MDLECEAAFASSLDPTMKILAEHQAGETVVRVLETLSDGSRRYYDGAILYTAVDRDGHNLLEYIFAMARVLKEPESLLLLGTAGGALATKLARRGHSVTAVDNSAVAFDLARAWFHLPPEVECVQADALEFLRTATRQWEAIAVDVFRGAEIPESMLTQDVSKLLAHALKPGGRIVWNVANAPRSWAVQRIMRAMRLAGFQPFTLAVIEGGVGNTLVVCRDALGGWRDGDRLVSPDQPHAPPRALTA